MVMPDFLIKLLELLHLKDSEATKLKKRIAQCDENIRSLNQGLERQIKDIKDLEAEFRELKVQYDASNGPVRETLAVRMKNILKQRDRMGEQRQMSEQQMDAEMLVRHNLVLQLEHIQHPLRPAYRSRGKHRGVSSCYRRSRCAPCRRCRCHECDSR